MRGLTIRAKLILALSLILLTAFVVLSVVNYQTSRKSVRHEIMTSSLPLIRENIYSAIHGSLIQPILVSSTMANDAFLRTWARDGERDQQAIVQYLQDIRDRYDFFSVFFVSDKTNRYYHYEGVQKRISPEDDHDVWYYKFLGTGLDYQLDVDTDEVTGGILTIFMNHRLEDYDGRLLGVTGVGVRMDHVAELLRETQEKYDRRVYMVDGRGLVQAHSNLSLVERMNIRETEGIRSIADEILSNQGAPRNYEYDSSHGRVLLTASYVPELDWFLLVEQDEDAVLSTVRGNLARTLGGGLLATILVILVSVFAVDHFQKRLERMAVTDELTGVANRRRLDEQFEQARARHERDGTSFSIMLIDLDGFKLVNDRSGHLEGDRVLCSVAKLISKYIRPMDLVARWGGDEFMVLAESGLKQTGGMAERIRSAVERAQLQGADGSTLTLSAGVAEYRDGDTLDSLTCRADDALYLVKNSGRNAVGLARSDKADQAGDAGGGAADAGQNKNIE
ncbi:diguanylate cyclase (GGDEF) domain-containing protein [Paucidesulfovibrio gracilis DSM 16080]|uniref:diguanylate cyclase n=1 Tax=Paucidesulfovibrio gracilis DSM 16080 TaxID=1121449 RepID=A0A1T4XMM9_9BACT|nr:sensor domain-containing diguanylate cyclase [Paucidesulfovibrio gracilis]SKA90418.1 diguanylate cyclase (GGDEF) domain-containing protein [Paucidesulfovibrio gracilis DSM 16080]